MMTTHKTNRSAAWKYALVFPILIGLVFIFSCKESPVTDITTAEPKTETTPKSSPETFTEAETENVYKVVEEMPRFPGCESLSTMEEKKRCSDKKMLEFISSNLKYPKLAKDNGLEGTCVAQFIVTLDGSIENIKVVREIGGGTGEATRNVIEKMNNMSSKWISGRQRGKPVKVMYTLPVKFKLAEDGIGMINKKVNKLSENNSNTITKNDVKGKPLYIIDGVETDISLIENMNYTADSIMMYFSKSTYTTEKYGEKAKYGVIELFNPTFTSKN